MRTFSDPAVAAKFDAYPPLVRRRLLALRELVLRTAAATQGVGEIEESLKWGEPAYVTKNKAGSTIRMDWKRKDPTHYAMYFNCQTTLVQTFRTLFPHDFKFEGNTALVFSLDQTIAQDSLAVCIAACLTYHVRKKDSGRVAKVNR